MTRAPIKLSREMKLLLLLLLMVALIGAWYVWTSSQTAGALSPATTGAGDAVAQTDGAQTNGAPADPATGDGAAGAGTGEPPATPDTPGTAGTGTTLSTVPLAPAGNASGQDGADNTLTVQPNRPVEIEVIPPFPTPDLSGDGAPTSTPGGINPQASVAAVPGKNPFRPLNLDPSAQNSSTQDPASRPAAATPPVSASSGPDGSGQNDSIETTPVTPILPGSTAGPLALSPIPGAVGSGPVTNGLGSLSPIPGASSGAVSGQAPERTISGDSGDSGVTVIGNSGTMPDSGTAAGAAALGGPNAASPALGGVVITAPKPPKPVAPPIAGMNVPSVTRVPARSGAASPPAAGATAAAPGAGTSRPLPGTPQVITSLGQDAADSDSGASPDARKLDQFVQQRQLSFNAAVLGPINTAIFRGQDGYVVVAVGQTLPNSQVTVKEVSAASAVLSLGSELKTLELDQR
ncbi:hypothetical protein GCM10010840_00170 [Deinococcus aerolatus]|uniref:Uncharacterized protein n=1 Tax=Deinococcus aerolatus TaxID=522487 RepID=A0ABQ2FYN1_9DEIO|nr:hypothetical protein [Deinococcus aerolatus]GGL66212.1 hypothetical protein GCM10010840_00170 [Deinococcus aerolatus]